MTRTATIALTAALALAAGSCTSQPAGETDRPDKPHEPAAPRPPADAMAFGGHWYKVYDDPNQDLSWHEKKALCEKMGGYLACIESAEEQRFVAELVGDKYVSLGATDEKAEGVWVWVNGSPWEYTAWFPAPRQPNNYAGEEHYLSTYDDGLWADVAAEGYEFWMPVGYLCEWEPPSPD